MSEIRRRLIWLAILVVAVVGFFIGRGIRIGSVTARSDEAMLGSSRGKLSALTVGVVVPELSEMLREGGSTQLELMFSALDEVSTSAELERYATGLLADQVNGTSESLWALLLARWSEIEPEAMMAFVDGQSGHTALPELKKKALFAWGAVDPDGAFVGAKKRTAEFRHAALSGMATRFPDRAVEFALKMPDAQFAMRVVASSPTLDNAALDLLLKRSFYDQARVPVQKAIVERLAKSDPAAAIESAQKAGRPWHDQLADAFGEVAKHDVAAALELLETLPDSRQRAISSVEIAKQWALQDSDAALQWTRESLPQAVRDSALVEIAGMIGGRDPMAGLALIEEVGWAEVGKFHKIQHENHDYATSESVGGSLLRQIATTDPEAAQTYIHQHVPEALAEKIRTTITTESPYTALV